MTPDLWKLREWLTIREAAHYLSSAISQEVSEADILRLGLDGQLKLSVNLPTGAKGLFHPEGANVTTRPTSMTRIEGLWDLSMVGAGKQQVEHEYHFKANLPFISVNGIAGAWVERSGVRRQLVPMAGSTGMWSKSPSALSDGSVLGVRVSALDEFAAQMSAVTSPRASSPSEEVNWRDRWRQQDAWTVREFAQLCCGLNPNGVDNFPDNNMEQYNEARDSINRAVRVKVLPTIDELAWPATGGEQIYEATPAFKPCEVASWAAKRYPSTFPYLADAWEKDKSASANVVTELAEGERYSATWGDVKIEFTSDERVQITVRAKNYTRNYADMGFEDGRKKTPNRAWEILQQLAESRGTISASSPKDWPKIEKRIQEIRRILRAHFLREGFDIPADPDPLPFVKGSGYRASFAIATRPSYHT